MSLISDLIPTNYLEEKSKFLNNPTFNPQFEYKKDFSEKTLVKYGFPKKEYLDFAKNVLKKALENKTPQEILNDRGDILSEERVEKDILNFFKKHNLEKRFSIIWKKEFSSRATVYDNTINLRLPCSIRQNDLLGLIYHELGTHILRKVNYEKQPWYKKKKHYGFSQYLQTEEGLAVTHAIFPKKNSFAYIPALNYLTVDMAQNGSFLEIYNFLSKYLLDKEQVFSIAFRKKRGLANTSKPGGFTKDLVYFEGFVKVIKFLIKKDFPLEELYFGKLSTEDIIKAVEMNPKFKPMMPSFYNDDPEEYKNRVREIAEINGIVTSVNS